jgi:HlyD family secretion protein
MTDTLGEIRRHLLLGAAGAVLLTAGVGGWAVSTEIAGAVFAEGQLVVESNVKKVQHPYGGVVSKLSVREGDRVRTGDVLVRLDETVTRANLAAIDKAIIELSARQARGEAERDGLETIAFPDALLGPEAAWVVRGEAQLFAMRRSAREGQKAQLRERIGQLAQEVRGITEQVKAKDAELALISRELAGARELWGKNLIPIMRLTALERDAARIAGERGALLSAQAQARGRIAETELQIIQIDQALSAEVGKELAEIRAKMGEFVEKRTAAEDTLKRIEIRAPSDGIVYQLAAHTVGGVVPPGEPLMLIVPDNDALIVEAAVPPHEIDRLWIGQAAALRFAAFNQATTPELAGSVSRISPDVIHNPKTGVASYAVRITIAPQEIARLGDLKLTPGMPLTVFIQTGGRTVASYLTKPFVDHLAMAWRER